MGDGAKYVCNIHHIKQQEHCVYYGVGVDGEVHFDEALVKYLPHCEMHAFDPTPGSSAGLMPRKLQDLNITFHKNYGLTASDGPLSIGNLPDLEGRSLATIRRQLGHTQRPIDILKIDIEGSEWEVLESIMEGCDRSNPVAHQLQIEFHSPKVRRFVNLVESMLQCGYRPFAKDTNYYCMHCIEYAFVHENFVKCVAQ